MEFGIGPTGLSSGWRALNRRSECERATIKGVQQVVLLTALALVPALLHAADSNLNLPVLVATDLELAAAVFRTGRGEMVVQEVGDPIGAGRWRLESVSTDSATLSIVDRDDREASTRIRLFPAISGRSPLVLRTQAPEQAPAPRLVIQTGTLKHSTDGEVQKPEKRQ